MANDRGLAAALVTELTGGIMRPHFRVELELPSGTVRLWTGLGDLTADDAAAVSRTWSGDERLLNVSGITETMVMQPSETTITLSGADNALRSAFIDDDWHGQDAKIWLALILFFLRLEKRPKHSTKKIWLFCLGMFYHYFGSL